MKQNCIKQHITVAKANTDLPWGASAWHHLYCITMQCFPLLVRASVALCLNTSYATSKNNTKQIRSDVHLPLRQRYIVGHFSSFCLAPATGSKTVLYEAKILQRKKFKDHLSKQQRKH